ncbi:MAG TPA: hypothetical protein VK425_11465 [Acidimicrobiales bacterium]|nr:hypothetical protein [Acidimicrobiales bacterium]
MAKLNCWQFKKCGREPGGSKVGELGICPSAVEVRLNGVNGGQNGGRACWALTGTLCGGQVQGTFAAKLTNCLKCEFYTSVATEEGGVSPVV